MEAGDGDTHWELWAETSSESDADDTFAYTEAVCHADAGSRQEKQRAQGENSWFEG